MLGHLMVTLLFARGAAFLKADVRGAIPQDISSPLDTCVAPEFVFSLGPPWGIHQHNP